MTYETVFKEVWKFLEIKLKSWICGECVEWIEIFTRGSTLADKNIENFLKDSSFLGKEMNYIIVSNITTNQTRQDDQNRYDWV